MPHRLFMEEVFEKVKKLSYASKKRNLLSQLGRYGQQVSCDKQGRIALSTFLLEHAQITDCTQVAINGCITTFEIRRPAEVTASEESIDAFLDQLEALEDEVNT